MLSSDLQFCDESETAITATFLENGYAIVPAESMEDLDRIRNLIADLTAEFLGIDPPKDREGFLNGIHERMDVAQINSLRLHVIQKMNEEAWLRPAYFRIARQAVNVIVGNELAMQRRVNLSIQMPKDASSILPIHSDVWQGDSPYEVVVWVPFVDVSKTKSMFLLPMDKHAKHIKRLEEANLQSTDELMQQVAGDAIWLDVPYGSVVLFTQNVMHGNVLNVEDTTRWSTNCRFKSIFSPYADKKLGEFFEPVVVRPATQLGAAYQLPRL